MMGGSPATTPRDRQIGRHLVTKRGSYTASQVTQLIELGAIATALSDPAIFDFGQLFKAHHDPRRANAPALRALPEALKWQARRPAATIRGHHWGILYVAATQVECWVIEDVLDIIVFALRSSGVVTAAVAGRRSSFLRLLW
ncbi:hypothetical protein H4582DRAFT_2060453 [Lactarius indigo]|nr:hypothetical protein H4582DRAFT_2060453 [Lactarius indigo]